MLKIKKNKRFFEKILYENSYNFVILPFLNKNSLNLNYIFHVSNFKNFLNLNLKGNLYICMFNEFNIFNFISLIKKNNLNILFCCLNGFFLNYINVLNIQFNSFVYNLFVYFNYIYIFINVLHLCLCFVYDLINLLKNILN